MAQFFAGTRQEFVTLFPVLLGVKNACNWATHGCTCASAETCGHVGLL